jgi:hypothetical protein
MNQPEQAALIWPVLVFAARMQRVVTYRDIEGFTGVPAQGQGAPLGMIHAYCESKHYPLLNSIVVSADTGFPGEGFPADMAPSQILVEQARVFAFSWTVKDKPRSEDFEPSRSATA